MLHLFLKNKLLASLLVSISVLIAVSALFSVGGFSNWQMTTSDVLYSEKPALSEIVILAIDDESIQELGRWPWDRSRFTEAISLLEEAAVVGVDVSFFEESDSDTGLAEAITQAGNVVLSLEYTEFSTQNGLYGEKLLKPVFQTGTGFVNIFTDIDGVTRSFTPVIEGVEDHRAFTLVIAEKYLNHQLDLSPGKRLINFFGKPGAYQRYSFADLIEGRIDNSLFNDKIVLIGATSRDLHDEAFVPISPVPMPGVEVNANMVQMFVLRDYIHYQEGWSIILTILVMSLLAGLVMYRFRLLYSTPMLAAMVIAFALIAVWAFGAGVVMNVLHPILAVLLVYLIMVIFYYVIEKRNREWVTNIFGKYVSKHVADEIINTTTKDNVKLGGKRKEITSIFADIRGFTALSEKMKPEEVIDMLNHYMAAMADIIFKYDGTLDKFMGDCIMAFFNSPIDQPDHALRGIKVALEMQEVAKELAKKEGVPPVEYGIGLNTGSAVVGNMGSTNRMEYTILGDSVNLASRMCSQAEGGQVIIAEEMYKLVKDKVKAKRLRTVVVKGKKKPITIYQVLGLK